VELGNVHGDDLGLHQGGILGDGLVVPVAGDDEQDGAERVRARGPKSGDEDEDDFPMLTKPTLRAGQVKRARLLPPPVSCPSTRPSWSAPRA
jgi:hypothetical protein